MKRSKFRENSQPSFIIQHATFISKQTDLAQKLQKTQDALEIVKLTFILLNFEEDPVSVHADSLFSGGNHPTPLMASKMPQLTSL